LLPDAVCLSIIIRQTAVACIERHQRTQTSTKDLQLHAALACDKRILPSHIKCCAFGGSDCPADVHMRNSCGLHCSTCGVLIKACHLLAVCVAPDSAFGCCCRAQGCSRCKGSRRMLHLLVFDKQTVQPKLHCSCRFHLHAAAGPLCGAAGYDIEVTCDICAPFGAYFSSPHALILTSATGRS